MVRAFSAPAEDLDLFPPPAWQLTLSVGQILGDPPLLLVSLGTKHVNATQTPVQAHAYTACATVCSF